MRWLIALLLLVYGARSRAQDLPLAVRLVDGSVDLPFVDAEVQTRVAARKARVRLVMMVDKSDTGKNPWRDVVARYTTQGDNIHHGNSENVTSDSFSYNSDGTPALRQWTKDYMVGCGTGMAARRTPSFQTWYVYEKGRLVRTETTSGGHSSQNDSLRPLPSIKEYWYDRRGHRTAQLEYFILYGTKTGADGYTVFNPAVLDTNGYAYATLTRNDRAGRPTQHFFLHTSELLDARKRARVDSLLAASPDDLGDMLLRATYGAKAPALGFFPEEPDTDSMSEEEEEAFEEALERREDLDDSLSSFYTDYDGPFQAFVGQRYDKRGRMVSRVRFLRDDLARRDTFFYDATGRLSRWESWRFIADYGDFAPPEAGGWRSMPLPTHEVRTFTYDAAGRVARSTQRYNRAVRADDNEPYKFEFDMEQTDGLEYDTQGRVSRIIRDEQGFAKDIFHTDVAPSRYEKRTEYAVVYETY